MESKDRQGFVPASCLKRIDSKTASQEILENIPTSDTIAERQTEIDDM